MKNATREALTVAAGFTVAAIVVTLPLALHPRQLLPSDHTDTLLNTWILGWDADRLRHALRGVWDAPIFFPVRDTLAFSENLLGVAIFVAPLYWATADPVFTYNVAFILAFAIAGGGMYLLAGELTRSRSAALAAGLYYAFGPFRMAQYAHVQMVATGWIPIALFALHRYFASRQRRWVALFAGAWLLQMLSNMYIGYFIALPIAIIVADQLLAARGERARIARQLTVAIVCVGAALLPIATAYIRARAHHEQVRSIDEIVANSADLRAYIVGKNTVGVWRRLPTMVGTDPEKELFPGLFAVGLAAVGVAVGVGEAQRRRWIRVYGAIAIAAITLSLGPQPRAWGTLITTHGPYAWLAGIVPGMDGMRVPARFAIIFVAALSVLVAFGVDTLVRRVRSQGRARLIAMMCAGLVVADGWATPITTVAYSARGRAEDRMAAFWLAGRAPGAILHLPMVPSGEQVLDYQFMTLVHHRPIVNGFSGFGTPLVSLLAGARSPLLDFEQFPAVVRMLRSLGVRYVLVHPNDYDAASAAAGVPDLTRTALRASGQIATEAALPNVTAFELAAWAALDNDERISAVDPRELTASASESLRRVPNIFDGDPDTRWVTGGGGQSGSSWVRVQLLHPADLARVDIQIAERSIGDYPRVLRITGEDEAGAARTLYDAAPYPELAAAIVRDGRYPNIAISLPHHQGTAALWIRQTAASRASWSIHELRVWRYDASGGSR